VATPRVLLHLGTPKTGTTFLQEVMWHHRAELAARRIHYPGGFPEAHFQAAVDLQGVDFNDWHDDAGEGAWGRMVDKVRRLSGTVVLSHELLGEVSADRAEQAMRDLAFADVELVLTLRDLGRQIPAAWQEDLKNRHYMSFEEFAAAVCPDNDVGAWYGNEFWRRQDVPKLLARWAPHVPPDKVHLITLPRRGAGQEELWRRFAQALGAPPDVVDVAHPAIRRNRSLGQREAQVLRRVNVLLEDKVPWPVYGEVMAHLAEEVLGQRRDPIELPPDHRGWVARCAAEMVEALRGSGHPVVGSLDELLVDTVGPEGARHPDSGSDAELLEVAVELIATALFLEPVPPPRDRGLPRTIRAGERLLWRTYGMAVGVRDAVRGRPQQAP
jgi:hypothetical protein